MEAYLDAGSSVPWAGHVPVQRLNRTEYANEVRGLLGVDIKVENLLPPEIEVDGFDNVAAALSVSPAFLDQYISAARVVARLAVGDAAPKVANTFYPAPGGAQDTYQDGMPLGTRGGMVFRHNFPADGEYRFNILDLEVGLYPWAAETRHTLVLLVDGQEVFRKSVGGPEDLALVDRKGAVGRKEIIDRFSNIPAQLTAGAHAVVVTFVERSKAESDEEVASSGLLFGAFDRLRVPRLLDGVQVVGPFGTPHLDGLRRHQPHVQPHWGAGFLSSVVPSRQRHRQDQSPGQDSALSHGAIRRLHRQACRDSGWRRHAAGQLALLIWLQHEQQ